MNRAIVCEIPAMGKAVVAEATVLDSDVRDIAVVENVVLGEARVVSEPSESRSHHPQMHRSPQSPLSMMDLMTLGKALVNFDIFSLIFFFFVSIDHVTLSNYFTMSDIFVS